MECTLPSLAAAATEEDAGRCDGSGSRAMQESLSTGGQGWLLGGQSRNGALAVHFDYAANYFSPPNTSQPASAAQIQPQYICAAAAIALSPRCCIVGRRLYDDKCIEALYIGEIL